MTSIGRRLSVLLVGAAFLAGLLSCSSTPTWNPGAPDAMAIEHYSMVLAAIDAKSKQDAQAALYLLRTDATRMRTNAADMQLALARMYSVTNAVDKEDWTAARAGLEALRASYGRPAAK